MSAKKILVFLTGGTICSAYKGDVKSPSLAIGTVLEKNFRESNSEFAGTVLFEFTPNFGIFSENMTVDRWNFIIKELALILKGGEGLFDGVIIAHGTDSLAYSTALFSILLKCLNIPVFFVSSNEALESDRANGNDNFRAAVDCICCGIEPGVYVTYKNVTGDAHKQCVYLHCGAKLAQCTDYSENFFSDGMTDVSGLTSQNSVALFKRFYENNFSKDKGIKKSSLPAIDIFNGFELKNTVLKITPYVGLDYSAFNLQGYKYVLHGTYHSGTVCSESDENNYSESSVRYLIDRCREAGVRQVLLAPAKGIGKIYDTVPVITRHVATTTPKCKVRFAYGQTIEMYYAKLLVAASLDLSDNETDDFISQEYCNEFNSLAEPEFSIFKCEEKF